MVRFIKKLFVYIALVILVPGLAMYGSIRWYPAYFLGSPVDYHICKFQYNQIDSANYKNIIIGDSRGNASVAPATLGNDWIDLSIPGTDFFEGFYTLKRYLIKNKPDTLIMIYGLGYVERGSQFFNLRTIPFQFVTPNELHALDLVEKKFGFAFHDRSVIGAKHLFTFQISRNLRYDHFPLSYRATFIDGLGTLLWGRTDIEKRSRGIEGRLREDLGHLNFGSADSDNTVSVGDRDRSFRPEPINLVYLDSIMTMAKSYNIKTWLVIPPMNKASYLQYKNSNLQTTANEFFNGLVVKYPQMHLIREPEMLDNTYFGDSEHLNARGTILYSATLRQSLSAGDTDAESTDHK
jgi:hypothetical protein